MPIKFTAAYRPYNIRSLKNEITAAHANVEIEYVAHEIGTESPEFYRNCHPLGCTPVLETPEGYLFESGAIMRYLARQSDNGLYGRTAYEASCCDQWIDFAAGELDDKSFKVLMARFQGQPESAFADAAAHTKQVMAALDQWLETRTFLVGERLTVADIAIASSLFAVLNYNPEGEALLKQFKGCSRLYNTVMQHPASVEALKRAGNTFTAPVKPKEEKPAAEKPAKVEKPAKAEKAEKPPKDDDEEDDAPKEEKRPNPLDSLPPSNFVLDAFKREYSNNDTRSVAAPYFLSNFDPAGYTCFWSTYNYNHESKMQFMTANYVRGWFQRMEHTRKYAFGVALIIGEDKSHDIVSFWVFRGKGLPQIVQEVEDTELFTWKEIPDIQKEAAAITDYLCWEGPTIPKPVLEGRTFK